MFSNLWGRITGADKKLTVPDQQASFLGRIGDYTVVFPYGLYANLPDGVLLKEIAPGVAVPVTVKRPSDTERGEPVFFHPGTNARIIMRNSGDIELIPQAGKKVLVTGDFEVSGNTQIDGNMNNDGTATLGGAGGAAIARVGDSVAGGVITGGSATHTAT